jgi:hypothetical protein
MYLHTFVVLVLALVVVLVLVFVLVLTLVSVFVLLSFLGCCRRGLGELWGASGVLEGLLEPPREAPRTASTTLWTLTGIDVQCIKNEICEMYTNGICL